MSKTAGVVQEYLEYLVPDPYQLSVLMDFISLSAHQPAIPFKWCIALRGPHGVGKGAFASYILAPATGYYVEFFEYGELTDLESREEYLGEHVSVVRVRPTNRQPTPGLLLLPYAANQAIFPPQKVFEINCNEDVGHPMFFTTMIHHTLEDPEAIFNFFRKRVVKNTTAFTVPQKTRGK